MMPEMCSLAEWYVCMLMYSIELVRGEKGDKEMVLLDDV